MSIVKYFIIITLSITFQNFFLRAETWKIIEPFKEYTNIQDLDAINDSTFIVVCSQLLDGSHFDIRLTTNKGKSWDIVYKDLSVPSAVKPKITYASEQMCFVNTQSGIFLKSKDEGKTWEKIELSRDSVYSPVFTDDENGILYVRGINNYNIYHYYYTTDSGNHWKKIDIPDEYYFKPMQMYFFNINSIIGYYWDVDEGQKIVRIEDSLRTWTEYDAPKDLFNITFYGEYNCWGTGLAQNMEGKNKQVIYYSDDGCKTWRTLRDTVDNSTQLQIIDFADSQNGICSGVPYALLRTTDGGITWFKDELEGYPKETQGLAYADFEISRFINNKTAIGYKSGIIQDTMFILDLTSTAVREEREDNKSIMVYPNPIQIGNRIEFILSSESDPIEEIKIYDLENKLILSNKLISNIKNKIGIDVSSDFFKSSGIYIVQFHFKNIIVSKKIMVLQ